MTVDGRDKVEIASKPQKGRCVVAHEAIAAGEIIARAPVVILSAADCRALHRQNCPTR